MPKDDNLTKLPDDFEPYQSHFDKADELKLDLLDEVEGFKLYHQSKGTKYIDWGKALHMWLRNSAKFRSNYAARQQQLSTDKESAAIEFYKDGVKF